jgi:hypothetical protein
MHHKRCSSPILAAQTSTDAQNQLKWNYLPALSRRSRKAVEKDLRKLHRRGLQGRLDDLGELLAIARAIGDESTDRESVRSAVASAIDGCWGGGRESGPSLRDTMRLWFGLPAIDNPSAPDTSAMSSVQRHSAAWGYWNAQAVAKESLETFRTSKAAARYEALAKKLIELEVASSETAEANRRKLDEQRPAAPPDDDTEPETPAPPRLANRRKRLVLAGTLVALTGGLMIWRPWNPAALPLPPRGAIVNAQTGSWTMQAAETPAEYPVGVGEGPSEFRGCDITTEKDCRFPETVPPLRPRIGDVVEFAVRLNNGHNSDIPYLKLESSVNSISESAAGRKILPAAAELAVSLQVVFPSRSGELGTGPVTIRRPRFNDVYLYFNTPGKYGLVEVPGSSEIYNKKVGFLHRLPDGIMELGIALQHLGEPPTCHPCAEKYIRFVRFRARVINSESPGKRSNTGVG